MNKDGRYVVYRSGKNDAEVVRVAREADGTWSEESRHKIVAGACDCKAFEFHRTCSHLDAATEHGKAVPLDEAREIAGEVIALLGGGAGPVDEPYERGEDGAVTKIHVRLRDPLAKAARIRALWKGVEVVVHAGSA